jgi:anti-sigma factor RsiW
MDCAGLADQLISYHLGDVEDSDRDAIEAHLVGCSACVKAYVALKRATDLREHRPRPEVRRRLRAEVAKAFPPAKGIHLLARRIPLYQGIALAAVAAAIALVAPSVVRRVSHVDSAAAPTVDTSRTRAQSLHIY